MDTESQLYITPTLIGRGVTVRPIALQVLGMCRREYVPVPNAVRLAHYIRCKTTKKDIFHKQSRITVAKRINNLYQHMLQIKLIIYFYWAKCFMTETQITSE